MSLFSQPQLNRTNKLAVSWNLLSAILGLLILAFMGIGTSHLFSPYQLTQLTTISLDPSMLPYYAFLSVYRMMVALFFSILLTFIIGTICAKSKFYERLIIPLIDILQAVPIPGFLSLSIFGFIALFPNQMLGPECAAIFTIITSQVWNMILSFYQSLKTAPAHFEEIAKTFHLHPWHQFWQIEVPFTLPNLVWNAMLSLSAGWFFVVASEAISIAHHTIMLPGIGSYIATAVAQANWNAISYAIFAMFLVIIIYDQLLFRPLMIWSKKFHLDPDLDAYTPRFHLGFVQKTSMFKWIKRKISGAFYQWILLGYRSQPGKPMKFDLSKAIKALTLIIVMCSLIYGYTLTKQLIWGQIALTDLIHIFYLGLITGSKVVALVILCSLIWLPIGIKIGLSGVWSARLQPVLQFFASFPANLFYPCVVWSIIHFNLNQQLWTAPLMVLGSQWYILFNVIAGAQSIPKSLRQVTKLFHVKRLRQWQTLWIPSILPNLVTGMMTAAGGAWNASIVAEAVSWGHNKIQVEGLGQYIDQSTNNGHFIELTIGIITMCALVLLMNYTIWQPLHRYTQRRFRLN
jgi:NitT/TauT family transport system permease protein